MSPSPYHRDALSTPSVAAPSDQAVATAQDDEVPWLYAFLTAAIVFGVIAFVRVILSMG